MHLIPLVLPEVQWYGVFLLLALVAGWWLARRRAGRIGIPVWHIDWLTPLLLIGIAVGSRLGGRLSQLLTEHWANDRVLYGALLLGVGVVSLYGLATRIPLGRLLDAFAFSFLVGVGVLRLGCFQSGCCWGDVCISPERLAVVGDETWQRQAQTVPAMCGRGWPLQVTYPPESPAYRQQHAVGLVGRDASRSLPVHPVQLYEAAAVLLLTGFLALIDKYLRRWGESFGLALLGYSLIRFNVEWFRADNSFIIWELTLPQLTSILCACLCMAFICLRLLLSRRGDFDLTRRSFDLPSGRH